MIFSDCPSADWDTQDSTWVPGLRSELGSLGWDTGATAQARTTRNCLIIFNSQEYEVKEWDNVKP